MIRLATAALALSLASCTSVHTEIVIPATPDRIWTVLTAAPCYEEWNPVMVHADGEYVEGRTVKYRVREPNGEEYPMKAKVAAVVEAKKLNQVGGVRTILRFDHTWRLEPVEGGTRVIQKEEYRGIGVWFWDESWIELAYSRANEALRERVLADVECKLREEGGEN